MTSYSTLSDSELTGLLKQGDTTAFAQIFAKYKGLLFSHVYKKIRDREEARDIVQDVFAGLWTKREQINPETNLGGYLMMAVRHKVLDLVGHKDVQSRYFISLSHFAQEWEGATDYPIREKQLQFVIDKEIAGLPEKMREVFLMSRVSNLSHKEIAAQLGISEQTVSTQIKRALKLLRSRLGLMLYLLMWFKL
jgi:RNA polymerase sigma-70 factor (family 1)